MTLIIKVYEVVHNVKYYKVIKCVCVYIYIYIYIYTHTQSVPGGMCQISGECSLC